MKSDHRETVRNQFAALKADIDEGLRDLSEGRVMDFDAARIIERGQKLLADRSLVISKLSS